MNISRIVLILLAALLSQVRLNAQGVRSLVETPALDRVNAVLPFWLRLGGEERSRMESISGQGFQPMGDLYLLNRLRINMDVRALRWLRFSFQAEDSRVLGQNTRPAPASQKEAMDFRVGYVQLGGGEGFATLRAGRQGLDFGDGRLLTDPGWSNVGRVFDSARLTLRSRTVKLDLFSGVSAKVNATDFDLPAPGQHFHGAYGSIGGAIPGAVIEPYLFWRLEHNYKSERGKPGNLDEKTAGFRWAGKLPSGFDYVSEMAMQSGSWAGDRIGAWMGHWVMGRTWGRVRHKPRLYVEHNRASGDAGTDGRHGAFDVLFGSSHDKYGLTDVLCSSNVIHSRAGVQFLVRAGLSVSAAYSNFRLAETHDGLYSGGKVIVRSTGGAAGTDVGQEADVQGQFAVSRTTQIIAGYGHLFPGRFLRESTAGVHYHIVFAGFTQKF